MNNAADKATTKIVEGSIAMHEKLTEANAADINRAAESYMSRKINAVNETIEASPALANFKRQT